MIKKLLLTLAFAFAAFADTNTPTFIRGALDIRYNSRVQAGKIGVTDDYTMNMNISNSAVFGGTIKYLPLIPGSVYGVSQNAQLSYEINCDVVNPANLSEKMTVARVYGKVPITPEGIYQYDQGNLTVGLIRQGTESRFAGAAHGKPLQRKKGWLDQAQETLSLTRGSKGKVAIKKYDRMVFQNHKIPAGPIAFYPESTINGEMIYDYDRSVWYFNNVTITYYHANQQRADRLTGNIRWVESPARKTNGQGEYQFDVHVNEPPAQEGALFSAAADEASFFAKDSSLSAILGTMKYKDSIQNGTVVASAVEASLVGQKLDKQQVMNIFKLVFFSAIVPMNAE